MCSISGFNFKNEGLVVKMNATVAHRGPDGAGVFVDEGVSFGHNRLSILDLSNAADQPMKSVDGRYVIVFNGEIYNYENIKKELSEYSFKTKGDTEVILAAYIKWGKKSISKLNGVFALAIWDTKNKELILARDQTGVKPLYYFFDGTKFIFSSEIKAILEHNIPRKLSHTAFAHYMRLLYVPSPLTMFDGINKMPAKTIATLKGNNLIMEEYDMEGSSTDSVSQNKKSIGPAQVKQTIESAVKSQLISDRPLGIYLSGGIDSSVILSSVSKVRGNIDTFSIGFDLETGEEEEKFNKDFNLAKKTAKHFGAKHHEVFVESKDVVDLFEKCIWHLDEPISNPTMIPMFKLSEYTKGFVDVVLGGDGGDELFGGYERYRLSLISSYYRRLPEQFRNIFSRSRLNKFNTEAGLDRFAQFMFQKDAILNRVLTNRADNSTDQFFKDKFFATVSEPFEVQFMEIDRQTWLIDESLMRTDKMSMAHGVEARVPFLDNTVIELASNISLDRKITFGQTKKILKQAFSDDLPGYLFNQPKRGWFSPGAKWLRRQNVAAFAKYALSANYYMPTKNLFNWKEIAKIIQDHEAKREYNFTIIWALLTFQVWAKQYSIEIQ